ncbi:MAG: hypothetical protein GEU89_21320 [Kiloniellaceae bacterium]|nr:hypothetical protein [Kiloniellaceae bacterium]
MGTMAVGLLMAALLFDGGAAMTAKADAWSTAQQAARAGADQLDLAVLRTTGEVLIDPAAAESAAADWLAQAGVTGTVSATVEQVSVTVTVTEATVLLSAVGITSYDLSATATAEAIQT